VIATKRQLTNATASLTSFGKAKLMQGLLYKLSSFNATHILAKKETA
jgi:hypothetical protein